MDECKHGNRVGSAPGGEYLCGRCEHPDTERLTKDQMLEQYEVLGFAALAEDLRWCVVERKSDGAKGTLDFATYEGVRYYYGFRVT